MVPSASATGSAHEPQSHDHDLDSEAAPGDDHRNSKKRRVGIGSRGVANLTPEQLSRKRANDREAQRAIRERTKNQIETLENRIRELTSQQPYLELEAAQEALRAAQAENAEIKQRLASIVAMLQPLIGGQRAEEMCTSSPSMTQESIPTRRKPSSAPSTSHAPTPSSVASPSSLDQSWQGPSGGAPNPRSSVEPTYQFSQVNTSSCQFRFDRGHDSAVASEQLKLDFLVDPLTARKVSRLPTGVNGAQDSPQYNHIPMKHDWPGFNRALSQSQLLSAPHQQNSPHAPRNDTPPISSHIDLSPLNPESSWSGYSTPVKNCPATCALDQLVLDFLYERRQRASEGVPRPELVGPRYPSVLSLLNPAVSAYAHPLSRLFTDILGKFPGICTLPERVAALYTMFAFMRWQIWPTRENYEHMPSLMRPHSSQLTNPHPAWTDLIPFPLMRERIAKEYGPDFLIDNFFIPYTTTIHMNWPYEATDVLLSAPSEMGSGAGGGSKGSGLETGNEGSSGVIVGEELVINPVYKRHMENIDNWTLGEKFHETFPQLEGSYNLKMGDGTIYKTGNWPNGGVAAGHASKGANGVNG